MEKQQQNASLIYNPIQRIFLISSTFQHPQPVQFVSNLFLPGGFELARYTDSKVGFVEAYHLTFPLLPWLHSSTSSHKKILLFCIVVQFQWDCGELRRGNKDKIYEIHLLLWFEHWMKEQCYNSRPLTVAEHSDKFSYFSVMLRLPLESTVVSPWIWCSRDRLKI